MNEWICWPFSLLWITGTLYRPSARTTQHHSMTLPSVTSVHLQPESAHPADGACVCVCVKARDVGLYRMHWCIHEHVLSSVHLRATIATWLKYCFSMHIPNAHIYVTFQPLISPLHALLTDVAFVGFRWVHCEVTLYRMRSCLTPDDIQMRESKSCGVSGQPWLSWFTFCFELFRL